MEDVENRPEMVGQHECVLQRPLRPRAKIGRYSYVPNHRATMNIVRHCHSLLLAGNLNSLANESGLQLAELSR
jgi:hypothetical protein